MTTTYTTTSLGLRRLLEDALAPSMESQEPHLTNDEIIGFSESSLGSEKLHQVTCHLSACPDCAAVVESFLNPGPDPSPEQQEQHRRSFNDFLAKLSKSPPSPSPWELLVRSIQQIQRNWQTTAQSIQESAAVWLSGVPEPARAGTSSTPIASDPGSDGFERVPFHRMDTELTDAGAAMELAVHLKKGSPDVKVLIRLIGEFPVVPESWEIHTPSWGGIAEFDPVTREAALIVPGNKMSDLSELIFIIIPTRKASDKSG
jgi:hypothetical protein